jgi:isopentenyl diphosphate isomerase/L-lactate dehydrogenase-like FMN-dependent dehydrogenase
MHDDSHDQPMSLPVVLGPVGMAGMYSSRGEVKAANAAKAGGVPFTLSSMGVCDIHEVAQKTGVAPWFQLYMLKDRGFIKSVIERSDAKRAVQTDINGLRREGVGLCIGGGRRIRGTRHVGHPERGAQGRHDSNRM